MGNITEKMQSLHEYFQGEIPTLYTREDIENKIEEVKGQEGTSGYASRWNELLDMCSIYDLDAAMLYKNRGNTAGLLKDVPNRKRLKYILFERLHKMYKDYPASVHFMERLVRTLAPEFEKDSLRMAILKQFVKYTDYRFGSLENALKEDFEEEEAEAYESMGKKEQKEYILSKLTEPMFERILLHAESLDEKEWAQFMLMRSSSLNLPLEEESMAFLKETAEKEDGFEENCMDRLKEIELEMKSHLIVMVVKKQNGALGSEYDRYRQAKKDKIGAKKDKAELFRMADELASGKFYTNGKTRENLYLFGLAFDMTVCIDEGNDPYYGDRDFEKNLLFDYYNDNLLRYVKDEEYMEHSADYEAEPSGEGINYKNFAEIIYLYYMYRRDLKLSPAEKIKKAKRLINKCITMAKKDEKRLLEPLPQLTRVYKRNYINDVLKLDKPDEIAAYICKNYHVIPKAHEISKPKMLLGAQQNTMRLVHKEIMDTLKDMVKGDIGSDYEFGMDMNFILAECENWKGKRKDLAEEDLAFLELVESFEPDFIRLMQKLGEKLRTRQRGLFKVSEKTGRTERSTFTRTELIAMCSVCFQYDMDDLALYNVPDLFEEFTAFADPYLEECRFQRISVKNIYDMYVFYSLVLGVIY